MASLRLLADKQNKTVTEVMAPFKDILEDMVPPKKHLLKHQPAIAQMGLMDGNMFCTTLNPRLFEISEFYVFQVSFYCIALNVKWERIKLTRNLIHSFPDGINMSF